MADSVKLIDEGAARAEFWKNKDEDRRKLQNKPARILKNGAISVVRTACKISDCFIISPVFIIPTLSLFNYNIRLFGLAILIC